MSTSRSTSWHRLISRVTVAGMIVGITATAIGVFVMAPIANHSSSDDSFSSQAALGLVYFGAPVALVFAGLRAGEALRWRIRGHRNATTDAR
jgi:hypothetical protein